MMKRTRETDMSDPACPYCGFKLNCLPDKPGICPQCRNKVYVHFKQKLFDRVLLTRDQAQIVAKFIRLAATYKFTEKHYHDKRRELRKQNGVEPEPIEIIRALENPEAQIDAIMDEMATSTGDDDDTVAGDKVEIFSADDSMIAKIQSEVDSSAGESAFLDSGQMPGMGKGDSMVGLKQSKPKPEPKVEKRKTDVKFFAKESMRILKNLGLGPDHVPKHEMTLEARLGRKASVAEVVFSLFEEANMHGHENHSKAADNFLSLSRLFHSYGLRHFSIQKAWAKHRLLEIRDQGYGKVELLVASGNPKTIGEVDGKVLNLDEALRQLPLPDRKLLTPVRDDDKIGWCECDYLPLEDSVELSEESKEAFDGFLDTLKSEDSGLIAFDED